MMSIDFPQFTGTCLEECKKNEVCVKEKGTDKSVCLARHIVRDRWVLVPCHGVRYKYTWTGTSIRGTLYALESLYSCISWPIYVMSLSLLYMVYNVSFCNIIG